jgi:hypothetical protein
MILCLLRLLLLFIYPLKIAMNVGIDEAAIKPAATIMNFELLFIYHYRRPTLIT